MQAQQGDPEAFRSLVNRYERQLLYYLMRFTQNPEHAADALQEVWVTAFRGLKHLRAPEAFRVWLYQITHDRIVSLVRREARKEEVLEALKDEPIADECYEDHRFENAELVHRALGSLSPEHREVLTLRFLEYLSLEEIAETLRCQLGTVKSRLHYAKLAVRKFLEEPSHE
jgi:RNA polymerase sigma-70 factor (ECF subfamily)